MAWWGTLVGGAFGYMLGGPLGAVLGASLGRNFDRGLNITSTHPGSDTEQIQAAFFTATFSVMGHIAKADGEISAAEIEHANHIMRQMQLNSAQQDAARKLFAEGKKENFQLHDIVTQLRHECNRRTNLVQMFVEIQVMTAMADGELHTNERDILHTIAHLLGFSQQQFEHILNLAGGKRGRAGAVTDLPQAYKLLGINKNTSDADLKKAYRRLMSQHHPDKLVSRGLPEEMIKLATQKTQEIKAAYEAIKQSRDLK